MVTKKMKMKKAKDNHKIDPARYNFSINHGITKYNFILLLFQGIKLHNFEKCNYVLPKFMQ